MTSPKNLEKELAKLKERNKKVEADKSWETSWTRRILLIFFTYIAIGLYLNAIAISNPWRSAVVPAFGFYLSTLSLPFIRKLWEKHLYK